MHGNKWWVRFQDEIVDGEQGGGSGDESGGSDDVGEVESTPDYLFGDVTSDEATERFGYLRELPDSLRGLESRVTDTVNPLFEQMQALGEKVGSQPVFDPKLERFAAALKEYDPKLADSVLPALIEDLKSSLSITPLGPESLGPHVNPMLEQTQQRMMDQMLPALIDMLPFDANGIVNRDPQNPDSAMAPQTELQKDFAKWWEQSDVPTRKALGSIGVPYVQALQQFGKWRAELMRKKGQAAGNASARLSGAAQSNGAGRRETSSPELRTEEDGFKAYFGKRS